MGMLENIQTGRENKPPRIMIYGSEGVGKSTFGASAPNAIDTLLLQPWQLPKTKKFAEITWKHPVSHINIPMGLEWTDEFLMTVSRLTGTEVEMRIPGERRPGFLQRLFGRAS